MKSPYSQPPSFTIFPRDDGYDVAFQWILRGPVGRPQVLTKMYLVVPDATTRIIPFQYTSEFPQGNQRTKLPADTFTDQALERRDGRTILPLTVSFMELILDDKGRNIQGTDVGFRMFSVAFRVKAAPVERTGVARGRFRLDYAPQFVTSDNLDFAGAKYTPDDPETGATSSHPSDKSVVRIQVCEAGDCSSVKVSGVTAEGGQDLRKEGGYRFVDRDLQSPLTLYYDFASNGYERLRYGTGYVAAVVLGAFVSAIFAVVYRPREAGSLAPDLSTTPSGVPTRVIRAWARQNGHVVAARGPISVTLRDAYEAAHPGSSAEP